MLSPPTLTRRIALAAALLALLVVSAVGGVSYYAMGGQIRERLEDSLAYQSQVIGLHVQAKLRAVSGELRALAANTLVANALVDNLGRERYLRDFLAGVKEIGGLPITLALTDFKGRPVLQNRPHPLAVDADWVAREVVAAEQRQATLSANGECLAVAEPVIFANTGTPEGALVACFDPGLLLDAPILLQRSEKWAGKQALELRIEKQDNQAIRRIRVGAEFKRHLSVKHRLDLSEQFARLGFELTLYADSELIDAPLRRLLAIYSLIGAALLPLVLAASLFLARSLTRKLRASELAAQKLFAGQDFHGRLPQEGDDEVAHLNRAFNHVLEKLEGAYQSLQDSQQRLRVNLARRKQTMRALRQARVAAESASRAKTLFLANMSHELRTPLNAILGFAQLLSRDSSLSPEQRENLRIVAQSGEHLLELINNVLTVSKIEAGQMVLNKQSFDLENLLVSLGDSMGQRAREKGLRFSLVYPPAMPRHIASDERRLRQVLNHLLHNALKFTRAGEVSLRVTWQAEDQRRGELGLQVCDSGPGIAPADQEKIFQPFVQAEAGEKSHQGTGLGLAISLQLVRLLGGQLQVRSRLGQGACFECTIPVEFEAGRQIAPPPEHAPAAGAPRPAGEWAALPEALRQELEQALLVLDMQGIEQAIARIGEHAPAVAKTLDKLARNFQYERMSAYLRGE